MIKYKVVMTNGRGLEVKAYSFAERDGILKFYRAGGTFYIGFPLCNVLHYERMSPTQNDDDRLEREVVG